MKQSVAKEGAKEELDVLKTVKNCLFQGRLDTMACLETMKR